MRVNVSRFVEKHKLINDLKKHRARKKTTLLQNEAFAWILLREGDCLNIKRFIVARS